MNETEIRERFDALEREIAQLRAEQRLDVCALLQVLWEVIHGEKEAAIALYRSAVFDQNQRGVDAFAETVALLRAQGKGK